MIDTHQEPIKVIIGGVNTGVENYDYYIDELKELTRANNMNPISEVVQNLDRPVAGTYFGTGKIDEIKYLASETSAKILVVNDELSPTQIRNLEHDTGLRVIDRTELILEIFANRAQTKQAKLQVALARAQYEIPRLHTTDDSLDQQRGGGGLSNRGSGETKLELNRRTLGKQIAFIKQELNELTASEATRRKERTKSQLPQVALVGYTNAGKSTTMNQLIEVFGGNNEFQKSTKQVFEKDMLFATLDTNVRRINLPNNFDFLLSDTVGFVSNLPHKLVESFKATLQEAVDADLLVQVVDYSDPNYKEMIKTTNDVLKEIGVDHKPMIVGFNKADKTDHPYPEIDGNDIYYSAKDEKSIKMLSDLIVTKVFDNYQNLTLELPLSAGKEIAYLHANAQVIKEDYQDDKLVIEVKLDPIDANRFEKFSK